MPALIASHRAAQRVRRFGLLVLLGLAASLLPPGAFAHDDPCTWSGSLSSDWFRKENWDSCDDGTPAAHDEVEITGGSRPPVLNRSTGVKKVSLTGFNLILDDGATLITSEGLFASGGASIRLGGSIRGSITIGSGRTTFSATGTLHGPITVGGLADPLATLDVADGSAIVALGTITINSGLPAGGALGKPGGTGTLIFEGPLLTNNGTVREQITFRRPGVQTISGSGAWQNIPRILIAAGSRTTLANPVTLSTSGLDVTNRGVLAIGPHTLTLHDTPRVKVELESAIDGSGTVKVATNTLLGLDGVMTPTLELAATTTVSVTGAGIFAGNVVAPRSATLNVEGAPSARGAITLDGRIVGRGGLVYRGPSFTNNGSVTIPFVTFGGTTQTLQGTGYFSATTRTTIGAGARVVLASDHRLGDVLITPDGALDITHRTLTLMDAPVPLVRHGTFTTLGSTVVYSASLRQTVTGGGTRYHNLTLRNAAGTEQEALPLTVNGLLKVERGTFTVGAATSQDVRIDAGAVLATRPNTTLAVRGTWTNNGSFTPGTTSTVSFDGTAAQEIAGSTATTFDGLAIAGAGTTLKADAEARRHLALDADLSTGDRVLTLPAAATTAGNSDVIGKVRREGPLAASVAYSFGNPNVVLTFEAAGTRPSEVTMVLALVRPEALGTAIPRTYTITPHGGSGYRARLRLRYHDAEVQHQPERDLALWRLDDAKQRWVPQTVATINTTQNWVELGGSVTGSSQWTIAPVLRAWLSLVRN